jgi:pimeloyl-ACP methyl ester carboxylesterase
MPLFRGRGFDVYYEVHGTGEGSPLLYITGLGGSCQGWKVVTVPELSAQRPNILFDGRGVGQTGDPGELYTTADLADDALAVLDHLGVQRAHVLGTFLAGMVAQELAIRHPERVQSLLLMGTYARPTAKLRMIVGLWKQGFELGMPADLRVRNWLVWTLGDAAMEKPDLVEGIWSFHREDVLVDNRTFARQAEAALAHDTWARLDRIQAPALIACGDRDILTSVELHRELAHRIPRARLVVFRGVGHTILAEVPQRFHRMANRFMADVEAGRLD